MTRRLPVPPARRFAAVLAAPLALAAAGCAALPDVVYEPRYHNPFPQLARVAVLPFYNLSADPTVDQDRIAIAYYNELQQIPGFEVMPVGVAKRLAEASGLDPQTPAEFQELARILGVDAVIVGAVTEYSPYYPPRMGLAVNWYAANPCFHPIPPGYGLPWGEAEEEDIPEEAVFEAEFALAREQLKTQTPEPPREERTSGGDAAPRRRAAAAAAAALFPSASCAECDRSPEAPAASGPAGAASPLPPDWPDPRGFIPPGPSPVRPPCDPFTGPVITHVRLYDGRDQDVTEKLARYFALQDDARFGGWQAYLQRSDDFIRFCCRLHITETLALRGGVGPSRVVWRWPLSRYDR